MQPAITVLAHAQRHSTASAATKTAAYIYLITVPNVHSFVGADRVNHEVAVT